MKVVTKKLALSLIVALFYLGLPIQSVYLGLPIQTDLICEGGKNKPLACQSGRPRLKLRA
jgi:hypothetical protein